MNASPSLGHIREFFRRAAGKRIKTSFEKRTFDNKENGQRAATSAFFCFKGLFITFSFCTDPGVQILFKW